MKKSLISICLFMLFAGIISGASQSHTFVLVHGAWHGNWTFYKLKYELEKAGHTVICINLPGHGTDMNNAGTVTLNDYSDAIVNVLDTLPGKVVLVGHSMGGIAISAAAEVRPQKIDKLVFLAAFMPQSGQSMLDLAMMDSLSAIGPALIFDFANNIVDLKRDHISDIFYDVSTAEYVGLSKMLLTPEPMSPLITPLVLTDENYGSVRRFYIATAYDNAITPAFQQQMYTALPCEEVYSMNTEHSPFFSAPQQLKNILDKIGDDDKVEKKSVVPDNESFRSKPEPDFAVTQLDENSLLIHSDSLITDCLITIYNLDGSQLLQKKLNPDSDRFILPLNNLQERFIVVVVTSEGKSHIQKLVLKQ